MPSLEAWFNIVATCLDAMFLEAPVTMNIAKTAGYRLMLGRLGYWAPRLRAWGIPQGENTRGD